MALLDAVTKHYQFVLWPWKEVREAGWFWFMRYDLAETNWAMIYKWRLLIGPLEIRKWTIPDTQASAPGERA